MIFEDCRYGTGSGLAQTRRYKFQFGRPQVLSKHNAPQKTVQFIDLEGLAFCQVFRRLPYAEYCDNMALRENLKGFIRAGRVQHLLVRFWLGRCQMDLTHQPALDVGLGQLAIYNFEG